MFLCLLFVVVCVCRLSSVSFVVVCFSHCLMFLVCSLSDVGCFDAVCCLVFVVRSVLFVV